MERRYVLGHASRFGGPSRRVTHIVTRELDYLPDAYQTICSTTKRGELVEGPTDTTPLCARCSDITSPSFTWREDHQRRRR